MKDKIFHSNELCIPILRIIYVPEGEPIIEVKSTHTKKTESMPISTFVSQLIHEAYHPPVEEE